MGDRSSTSSIPADQYGPLNVYSGYRIDSRNPGGPLSRYSADGGLRMMNDDDPNQYMSVAWIAAQQALNQAMPLEDDQIAAIDAHVAAQQQPIRQSLRVQGIPADNTIDECKGKTCLITRSRLSEGRGILLSDGRCYDGGGIIAWYDRNDEVLPTRKPYDADDRAKIERWRGIIGRGGKKKRKGSRSRKGRKTRKGGKTRKGRRGRKTRKTRKTRK